jgi:hypothetical protein
MKFADNLFSRANYSIFVILLCVSCFSACSKTSQVDFKGDRASDGGGDSVNTGSGIMSSSAGGFTKQTTSSGFTVSASHGAVLHKSVSGTTAGGYKVEYNIQGQMTQ